MRICILLLSVALLPVFGQTTASIRSVRATGDGSVSVRPDSARVTISVSSQAGTASEAASQNATAASAVIAAERQLLGANADVKTVAYRLTPLYNLQQQITAFNAANTIQAVAADPNLAGRVVDTAIAAGATRIDGVQLFLRDDESAQRQALLIASQRARAHADAIAMGLGVRLGSVVNAQEAVTPGVISPIGAVTATTPVEVGNLEVRATVTVDTEILP